MTYEILNEEAVLEQAVERDILTDRRYIGLLASPIDARIDPTPFTRLFPSEFFETLAVRSADPQLSRMFRGLAGISIGMTAFDVGKLLDVHSQTVTGWVMKFRKMRIDGLMRAMEKQDAITAMGDFDSATLRIAAEGEPDRLVADALMATADVMDGVAIEEVERGHGIQPGWLERKLNGKKLKSAAAVRTLVAAHRIGLRKDVSLEDIEQATIAEDGAVTEKPESKKSLLVIKLLYEGHDFTAAARIEGVSALKVRGWHSTFMEGGVEALVESGSARDGRNKKTPREDVSREAVEGILAAATDDAVKARCRAILAWIDRETASVMAEAGNVSRQSVQQWKDRFNEFGTDWLLHGGAHRGNRAKPASHSLDEASPDVRRHVVEVRRAVLRDDDVILLARRVERAIRYKVPLSLSAVRNWLRIEREIDATNDDIAEIVKSAGFHLHGDHVRSEPAQSRIEPMSLAA